MDSRARTELLLAQKTEIDELVRLMRNYNKDANDRKTKRYLLDKKKTFDEIFRVIAENHKKLIPYATDSQPYFQLDSYEAVKRMYESTINNVNARLKAMEEAESSDINESSSAKNAIDALWNGEKSSETVPPVVENPDLDENTLDGLDNTVNSEFEITIDQRNTNDTVNNTEPETSNGQQSVETTQQSLLSNGIDGRNQDISAEQHTDLTDMLQLQYNEFTDMMVAARDLNEQSQRGAVKAYLDNITFTWNELRKMVFSYKTSNKPINFSYNVLLQRYMLITGKLNDFLSISHSSKSTSSNDSSNQFSLPQLKLPEFYGNKNEWKSFIAMFDKMVHNNERIDKGTKVEYLKTCIKGKASMIINHLDPYPENYDPCYALLRKRYDNKREVVGDLIDNILHLPKMKEENSESLRTMHDTVYESLMSIKNLGVSNSEFLDFFLCHILSKKLDSSTVIHYECQLSDVRELQTLPSFLSYIETRFMALQSVGSKNSTWMPQHSPQNSYSKNEKQPNSSQSFEKNTKCICCGGDHALFKCQSFIKKSVNERIELAKAKRICLNCISSTTHRTHDCKNKFTCRHCHKRHHSLLHIESKKSEEKTEMKANCAGLQNVSKSSPRETSHIQATVALNRAGSVLLATAMIGVRDKSGTMILLRALLDQGSQSAFITENAAQSLRLPRKSINAIVSGIGATEQIAKHTMQLAIFPRFDSNFIINSEAVILSKLTKITHVNHDENDFEFVNNLTLADPSFLRESDIDIILGASEYAQAIKSGLIKSEKNLIAQNTEFGWVVSGAVQRSEPLMQISAFISNVELDLQLNRFFASDDFVNVDGESLTEEEAMCEEHFNATHFRDESGRFVVKMPFKNALERPDLGDSRRAALASLFSMERRLKTKPDLKIQYSEFINEYINMKHMREVKFYDDNANYLPHHFVLKDSTTTKLRVVFNASQKTANGKSLNEQLAIGPTDQNDLAFILLRWRRHRVAFTADIEKMYRQIRLHESQTNLQRILWRERESDPIREYELSTVTYGMASAPYLAIRTLKQLAIDGTVEFPLAAATLQGDFYVDDVLSGADNVNEALKIYTELNNLMQSAHFHLRKWSSNSSELLEHIPLSDQELNSTGGIIKTLGVVWSTGTDDLSINVSMEMNTVPRTKRQLASEIASLYDPLGYICPVVIVGKSILQKIWRFESKIGWDDVIPQQFVDEWLKIKSEMNIISDLKFPRWINYSPDDAMELHGFCDASCHGYATAIYIVNNTHKTSQLLVAKARVSPIKEEQNSDNVTIPRLELCGALLLAQMTDKVLKNMEINFKRICLWTDSKIVLDWIHANPRRYKIFIASRIEKINKLVQKSWWSHVPTDHNAADCASRGITPSELATHSLWWNGPTFLIEKSLEPPSYAPPQSDLATYNGVGRVSDTQTTEPVLPNASSFRKLKRIIAFCFRFLHNCKSKQKTSGALTVDELQTAEFAIIKAVQNERFCNEIETLRSKKEIKASSSLRQLSPFLDENQILRVGGRLNNADLPYAAKHQILLPAKHDVSMLIITNAHVECLHGAPKLTESVLRQKFWVIHSQRSIKAAIHNCIRCFRAAPRTMSQYMADLPALRVSANEKPFTNTAVDYTGAIHVKLTNGRGYKTKKAYIAIFVCMSTKAIHVEAVTDMTAEAFIAAYRRFVARRGVVRNLFSDNGTNFVLSNKILLENMQNIDDRYDDEICQELAKSGTRWHFSPPGAPHMNGLAEAAVKSVKLHLKRTIADTKLTFEELSTLLTQIEACVNSRPLCSLSSDPNDVAALTPAHFLVGEPLISPPEPNHLEAKSTWLSKWQRVQQMTQHFWKHWQSDYLNQLQVRTKWHGKGKTPEVNDLVLIRDENLPSTQWKTGRVINTHPGADGLTRVVSLKTSGGVMKRPIAKLCAFPKQETETDDNTPIIKANLARVSARKRNSIGFLPIITAILALCTTCSYQNPIPFESHEVTHFNSSPGFYFEKTHDVFMTHSDWNVVSHLNLRKFRSEYNTIRDNLTMARDICFKSIPTANGCRSLVSHLQHKVDAIESRNSLIFGNQRSKRDIPTLHIIGDILGDITGTLGSKFEKRYAQDLSLIHENEDHLLLLLKNHTSIMDSTLNIIQSDEAKVQKHLNAFGDLINVIGNHTNVLELEANVHNFVIYLSQLINDYEQQQSDIIDILTFSRRSHISHVLFTPEQIDHQVELITKQVGSEYHVPKGIEVYSVSKISVVRLHNQIVFKLSIPLLGAKKFKLYKVIAVPTIHNKHTFVLKNNHKFMLTSVDRQLYQYLDNYDCKPYQNKKALICDKPNTFNTAAKSDCVWNVFNHLTKSTCEMRESRDTAFFESVSSNKFLFVLPEAVRVNIMCGDRVAHDQLAGEGMLTLKPTCSLASENVQLFSKIALSNDQQELIIPEIYSDNWTFPSQIDFNHKTMNVEMGNRQEIIKLRAMLNETNHAQLNQLSYHDIHHYSVLYSVLLLVVFVFVAKFAIKNKKVFSRRVSAPHVDTSSSDSVEN